MELATVNNLTRQVLYNNNMGSMCHVRGVMQHTTKHDFLVSQRCICTIFQFVTLMLCRCVAAAHRRHGCRAGG